MRFSIRRHFSVKKFLQALLTILLGLVAFMYALQTWMDVAHLPSSKPGDVEVILIRSGETKIVKANLRTLAGLVQLAPSVDVKTRRA